MLNRQKKAPRPHPSPSQSSPASPLVPICCGLLLLSLTILSTRAQTASLELVATLDTPSDAVRLHVVDRVAYVASRAGGLQIINVGNPAAPQTLASVATADHALHVRVTNHTAYVAAQSAGLLIVDVTSPLAPTLLSQLPLPGWAYHVEVFEHYACVSTESAGIQIVDIGNPHSPTLLGQHPATATAYAYASCVDNRLAFTAFGRGGLHVFDLQDPASPQLAATLNLQGAAYDVLKVDSTVFVAGYNGGLHVVDVQNPSQPTVRSQANSRGFVHGFDYADGFILAAEYRTGLEVFDVSNPGSPVAVGFLPTDGDGFDVQFDGSYAYLADGAPGLRIVRATLPNAARINTMQIVGDELELSWNSRKPSMLQMSLDPSSGIWEDINPSLGKNKHRVPMTNGRAFFRVASQE